MGKVKGEARTSKHRPYNAEPINCYCSRRQWISTSKEVLPVFHTHDSLALTRGACGGTAMAQRQVGQAGPLKTSSVSHVMM